MQKKKEVRMENTGENRIFSDGSHSLLSVLGPYITKPHSSSIK